VHLRSSRPTVRGEVRWRDEVVPLRESSAALIPTMDLWADAALTPVFVPYDSLRGAHMGSVRSHRPAGPTSASRGVQILAEA
jgi:hypothetical protein